MPSTFPYILSFWMYAPIILRIVGGLYFFSFGYTGLRSLWHSRVSLFETLRLRPAKFWAVTASVIEMFAGMLLLMGFFTQIAAAVLAVIALVSIIIKISDASLIKTDIHIYVLLLAILISLFILGPGYFAFDLPL